MAQPKDLNDVRAFVLAAREGSFSAAAAQLGQPASTVSRAITRLESELGAILFRRGIRGLTLTDEGQIYLPSCRAAIEGIHEAGASVQSNQGAPAGIVRVACAVTFARDILTPLLPAFFKSYPEIRLVVTPYASNWDQESQEEVDIHFKARAPRESRRHVKAYPGTRRGLFASKRYIDKNGAPAQPSDLADHALTGAGILRLRGRSREIRLEPSFLVETSDPYVHLGFVQQHLGIAALPLYMARWPENANTLVRVLDDWTPDPIILCALFTGRSQLTPRIHALLEFLSAYIGTAKDPRLHGQRLKDEFMAKSLEQTYSP